MKHRSRPAEQDDLLRPRLVDMIDPRHALVKLAALIDWEAFEREWSGFFPSGKDRPATPPRLVAGLLSLQHAYRLSDAAVVARWVENPYDQHLTGETFSQHKLPIDPSSLTPLPAHVYMRERGAMVGGGASLPRSPLSRSCCTSSPRGPTRSMPCTSPRGIAYPRARPGCG